MSYTYNADVTSTDNYTLYLREETNLFKEYLFAFFKYSNYRMYLSLDLIDEDILNDLL